MKWCPLFALSIAAVVAVPSAVAGITWERQITVVPTEPGAGSVVARFPFQNTGKAPVTVRKVSTSCGCTAATLEKKTWAPGERGELEAKYYVGERKGVHATNIVVTTDDGAEPVTLQLQANVSDAAEIKPTLAFWKKEEPLTPKRLLVTMRDKADKHGGAQPISAASDNPQVDVKVEPTSDGNFALIITPAAHALKSTVSVTITLPDGKTRVLKAFAKS